MRDLQMLSMSSETNLLKGTTAFDAIHVARNPTAYWGEGGEIKGTARDESSWNPVAVPS
jgi:hypothetical protein